MARNWVVLTADRSPHTADEIISFTHWDGYEAAADEVVYSDPVNVDGESVDGNWKVSGSVTLNAGVYIYTDHSVSPTLAERQRAQIFEAYLYWRVFGRTDHWSGLRKGFTDIMDATISVRDTPLESTDKWAVHVLALGDQAIHGVFPVSGAYTPEALQDFLDYIELIFRTLGPTWYLAQIDVDGVQPTPAAKSYSNIAIVAGTTIYTDIVTVLGVHLTITGIYESMAVPIRAGFNPEDRNLGN